MEIKARYLVIALAAATGLAQGAIYKWVDEQGRVVYSQTPRPEAQKVTLPQARPPARPVAAPTASQARPQPSVAGSKATQSSGRYCSQARRNVRLLRNAGPDTVFVTRDKKLVKYSDEERRKRLSIAKKAVDAYCLEDRAAEVSQLGHEEMAKR